MDTQPPAFDTLIITGADGLLILGLTWVLLILASLVVESRTGGRVALSARLGCPTRVRVALLALLTALSVAAPATARQAIEPTGRSLDGLAVPDRFGDRADTSPVPREQVAPSVSSWVTVRPGDSLWSLVRQRLPPGASDSSVAARTRAAYRTNAAEIGPDPDRILPGQHLELPPARPSRNP